MRILFLFLASLGLATALFANDKLDISDQTISADRLPRQLSYYGFFDGGANKPHRALIRYRLRNPLFSDYAEKERFLYLPAGAEMTVNSKGKIEFPVGTVLIKSFGYISADESLNILETRLLVHRSSGWIALPYVWRADGSDADLKVGGKRIPVSFTTPRGKNLDISYAVPNKNQCKQCHSENDKLLPIGPVWQDMIFENQAAKQKIAKRATFPRNTLFGSVKWDDPASGSVKQRAGAYLAANCAHCHSRTGSASNSGLFYDNAIGFYRSSGYLKRPVAAGRGSGGHDFVIAPGHPEQSILIHRMKSLDPGVAMPELGRATVHAEGIELLEKWIRQMPVPGK